MSLQSMHGKDLIILLKKAGFKVVGERGGHVSLRKGNARLIIPSTEQLSERTLENLIEQANLSPKEVATLLSGETIEPEPEMPKFEEEPEEEEEAPSPKYEYNFWQHAWYSMTNAFPIALVRMLVGLLFLLTAFETAPWLNFGWFPEMIATLVKYPAHGFTTSFLTIVVQPGITPFAWMHFLFNLFLGLALLLGFFGRIGSVFGFLWASLLFFFRTDFSLMRSANPNWWVWTDIMLCALMFLFWTMKASRTLGVDQKLSEYFESRAEASMFFRFMSLLV